MRGNESVEEVGMFSTGRLDAAEVNGRKRAIGKPLAGSAMLAAFFIILAVIAEPSYAADNWAWVSKGPVGTDARHLVCSSNNAGVVYVGTNGGVYKTTDYGSNWFYSGLRFRAIDALRGSGGCSMGVFAGASGDVFQSIDGGNTWNLFVSIGSETTALLITNPTSPFSCQGYVGTGTGVLTPNGPGLSGKEITALAVDSGNNVYAGTDGNGIYKTTDNGVSWNQKNNGLSNTQIFGLKIDGSGTIFAGTLGGVFRSTTGGDSWEEKNSGLPEVSGMPGVYAVFSFAKDSNNNLYAGVLTDIPPAGTVYKSTDNGDDWEPTDSAIDGYFPESMCTTPDNELFVGTNLGIFRTDDAGTTWDNQTNKISAMPFTNSFVAYDGTIFIGTNGSGVFESSDEGETWLLTGTGGPQCIGALLGDGDGNLYASTCDVSGVYKSGNGGADWTLSSNGLPTDSGSDFLIEGYSLGIDGAGAIYVGLENGTVYKTTDGAGNWTLTADLQSNSEIVTALAGIGTDAVLAGTDGNGIYKTTDGGGTWTPSNAGLPANADVINDSFFVDPSTGDIYVGLWEGGLYRSTNSGANWTQVMPGDVSGCDVRSVARLESGPLFAVVCSGAVYWSEDDGDTWSPFVTNMLKPWDNISGINVTGIFAYNGNGFISTESSGMYKFSKDLAIIEGAPTVYYSSLQDAYNAASLVSTDTILALAVNFYSEDLSFNTPDKSVVLKGGYEAGFSNNPDMTSISAGLEVSQGTVVLQNIIVEALTISGEGEVQAENVVVM